LSSDKLVCHLALGARQQILSLSIRKLSKRWKVIVCF